MKGDDRPTGLAIGLYKYFQPESRPTVEPRFAAIKTHCRLTVIEG